VSAQLKKDLEYVLPTLKREDRTDEGRVLSAIVSTLPERRGAYTVKEVWAHIKDNFDYQQARIQRVANDIGCGIEFDNRTTWIRFRVKGYENISAEWQPSIWADKSDDWLRQYIRQLMQP
jgi:RNA:NAD 2'-phosphotransferase (TPT1/KptA family)